MFTSYIYLLSIISFKFAFIKIISFKIVLELSFLSPSEKLLSQEV